MELGLGHIGRTTRRRFVAVAAGSISLTALAGCTPSVTPPPEREKPSTPTYFRTARVQGVDVFYREAGPTDAPTIVLLHGYPTSSRMYRHLIPMLSDRYHVIAPDYPAFGHSGVPPRSTFAYTHEHLAEVIDALLIHLNVGRRGFYLMDFGGPIGYRIMLEHQDQFAGAVLQNTPAFGEETSAVWGPLLSYWRDGSEAHREAARFNTSPEAIKDQYLRGVRDPARIDPEGYTIDSALISRDGVGDIMMDLLYDIRNNKAPSRRRRRSSPLIRVSRWSSRASTIRCSRVPA